MEIFISFSKVGKSMLEIYFLFTFSTMKMKYTEKTDVFLEETCRGHTVITYCQWKACLMHKFNQKLFPAYIVKGTRSRTTSVHFDTL